MCSWIAPGWLRSVEVSIH